MMLSALLRHIAAKYAESRAGRFGGMVFHAASHVSLTHSSPSRSSPTMFMETARQYAPYFSSLSLMAR